MNTPKKPAKADETEKKVKVNKATMALDGRPDGMNVRKAAMIGLRFGGELQAGQAELDFYLTPKLARMLKG